MEQAAEVDKAPRARDILLERRERQIEVDAPGIVDDVSDVILDLKATSMSAILVRNKEGKQTNILKYGWLKPEPIVRDVSTKLHELVLRQKLKW